MAKIFSFRTLSGLIGHSWPMKHRLFSPLGRQQINFHQKKTKYYAAAWGILPQWDNMYFKSLGTLISHFPLNHPSLPAFGVSVLRGESIKLCMATNWYSELKVVLIINSPPLHYPVMIQMNYWEFFAVSVTQNVWECNVSLSFLSFRGCRGVQQAERKWVFKRTEQQLHLFFFSSFALLRILSFLAFFNCHRCSKQAE